MDPYAGFEPEVGEIRAVRTFRVGPGGVLYPLFSNRAWTDGTNTAQCRVIRPDDAESASHAAPEPDCTCGFYAYASAFGAAEYPNAKHVLAVVACWGRVVAGTRGLRAEYARVEAIWLSNAVPAYLAEEMRSSYPSVAVYADKTTMLAEHPPTELDCYDEPAPRERTPKTVALWLAIAGALVMGVLPWQWLRSNQDVRVLWLAELAFFVLGAVVLGRKNADRAARRRSLLFLAVALWLVAPSAGTVGGLLLRIPLLQVGKVVVVQRIISARLATSFPADIR
jgi:hypothetical protein